MGIRSGECEQSVSAAYQHLAKKRPTRCFKNSYNCLKKQFSVICPETYIKGSLQLLYNFLGGDSLRHWNKKCEKRLEKEFDRLEAASRDVIPPSAPPGEFESIMAEMERRGIEPRIRKELKKRK